MTAQGAARVSIALEPAEPGGAVDPERLPAEEAVPLLAGTDPVDDRGSFFERIGIRTYIAAGVTIVLLGAAIVTGVLSLSARSDFDASTARSENPALSLAARQRAYDQSLSDADRANGLALAADALGVASLVGAGVTVALLIIGLNSDSSDSEDEAFAVAPLLNRDGGGLGLSGRF